MENFENEQIKCNQQEFDKLRCEDIKKTGYPLYATTHQGVDYDIMEDYVQRNQKTQPVELGCTKWIPS